ncbi:molybdopterin-guanine dinucleotide biosynthesis protein B, partial [Agrobacterium sp. S2]|nr:molybdopterin-guanine dinucleotide biosynthesis protein B [Agrobacterium sp. S2]
MTHKLFGITGWKNSGKTTLTEKLVRCLTERGYRIATIKHAHHNFDIDQEGTDSWRHRQAGAAEVAIVSERRFAIMH